MTARMQVCDTLFSEQVLGMGPSLPILAVARLVVLPIRPRLHRRCGEERRGADGAAGRRSTARGAPVRSAHRRRLRPHGGVSPMREPTKVATVAQIAALPGIREVSAGSVYNSTPLGLPGAIAIVALPGGASSSWASASASASPSPPCKHAWRCGEEDLFIRATG